MNNKKENSSLSKTTYIFGRKAVKELLRHRPEVIIELFGLKNINLDISLKSLIKKRNLKIKEISKEKINELSKGVNHQGLGLKIKKKREITLEALIKESLEDKDFKNIVVLDRISDPYNLGSILRVSNAVGVRGVISTKDNSSPITEVSKKVSVGALEFLNFYQTKNLQRTLKELKKHGYWIIGLHLDKEKSLDLYKTKLPTPCAIVLGSESKGLRRLSVKECDLIVRIPMIGEIDSLNVSQATSVFLYELLRQSFYLD